MIRLVVAGVLAALVAAPAAEQAAPTVIKDGKLDLIKLHVAKFPGDASVPVLVRRFSSDAASLGTGGSDGKPASREEAAQIQKTGPDLLATSLVEKLKKGGFFKSVLIFEASTPMPPLALVIEGRFITLDPGDTGKRKWVGMGSGKTLVAVEGVVKDAAGQMLAEFSQERFGASSRGGALDLLTSDAKSIGQDIAGFLDAWARGKKLN